MTIYQIIIMVAAIIALIAGVIGWIYGLYRLKWWVIELIGIVTLGHFIYPYAVGWLPFFDSLLVVSIDGFEWNIGVMLRAIAIYMVASIAVILVCQILKAIYKLILPKYTFDKETCETTYHRRRVAKFFNGLLGAIFYIVSIVFALAILGGGVLVATELGGFEILPQITGHELWVSYRAFVYEAAIIGIILFFFAFGFSKGFVMHVWVLFSFIGFLACFFAGYLIQTKTPLGGIREMFKPMFSSLVPDSQLFYANLVSMAFYGVICAILWIVIICLLSKLLRLIRPPLVIRVIDGFIAGVIWLVLIVAVVLVVDGVLQAFLFKEEMLNLYYSESPFLTEFFGSNHLSEIIKSLFDKMMESLQGLIGSLGGQG